MSLFDDDFYSTRVSRRTRWAHREEKSAPFGKPLRRRGGLGRSSLGIALASSLISAAVVVLVFGLVTGFHRGGAASAGVSAPVSAVKAGDPQEKTIQAAAKVRPAVVSIINEQALPPGASLNKDPNSDGQSDDGLTEAALGSGFIFEKVKGKAHILTNYHVIADAKAVKAVLSDGQTRDATIVGKDQVSDLAVLAIDDKGIDTVTDFGDSNGLRAGQWVMAIGNPLGLSDSLSVGIVSKTKRVIPVSLSQDGVYDWEQEVIQIDASINQGNSGGPLIDLDGHVVGINSMKVADFGVEGVGFAIPSDVAQPIVQSLLKYGKVKRPYLGVYTMDLSQYFAQMQFSGSMDGSGGSEDGPGAAGNDGSIDPGADSGDTQSGDPRADSGAADPGDDGGAGSGGGGLELTPPDLKLPDSVREGVLVLEATGPAEKAGLTFNDVIVKLDNQSIDNTIELRKYLYDKKAIGDTIEITFYREGKKMTTSFELGENTDG